MLSQHPQLLSQHSPAVIPDLIWDLHRMLCGCLQEILKRVQDDTFLLGYFSISECYPNTSGCHPNTPPAVIPTPPAVIPDLIWDLHRMLCGCLQEILKRVQDDTFLLGYFSISECYPNTSGCHPRLDLGSPSDAMRVPAGDPETSSG